MPLPLPNLDDRTYTDLVDEAIALIPNFAPEWTNHNPSDPGITLIELFAYLAELLLYQQNQITEKSLLVFLKFLNGPAWQMPKDQTLEEATRLAVLNVRKHYRAVTVQDFEALVSSRSDVARVRCLPRRNLEETGLARQQDSPAHVSIVVLPTVDSDAVQNMLQPDSTLLQNIEQDLEPARLLTTKIHAVGPRYLTVGVRLTLMLEPDHLPANVQTTAKKALENFLDPRKGGSETTGWPFGRSIYVSEIYDLLDRLPGVDYVTRSNNQDELYLTPADATRLVRNSSNELVAIALEPDELVNARIMASELTATSPVRPYTPSS